MKILFLDIDGVLNCTTSFQRLIEKQSKTPEIPLDFNWPNAHLDELTIPYLNLICEKTRCNIVISSSWRLNLSLDQLKELLENKGFKYKKSIIDITPNNVLYKNYVLHHLLFTGEKNQRGIEIQLWLDANKNVLDYAILDDDPEEIVRLHPNNLVKTNSREGLTENIVQKVISLLNKETL